MNKITFAVSEIVLPATFVAVFILIILNSESMFFIVLPVSIVATVVSPLLSLDCAIFGFLLFFDPIDGSMRTVLLCLCIIFFPKLVTHVSLNIPALAIHSWFFDIDYK
jgi:hypothetical protein